MDNRTTDTEVKRQQEKDMLFIKPAAALRHMRVTLENRKKLKRQQNVRE